MLWGLETFFLNVWNGVTDLVYQVGDGPNKTADPYGEKTKAQFTEIEVVYWGIDQRKDLKQRVKDCVVEGGLLIRLVDLSHGTPFWK